jgi:dihydrofolate reductase
MKKLTVFNFITLNGFYKDSDNGIGWHNHDRDGDDHAADAMRTKSTLLFGRITYDMMASFWPTPMAMEQMPDVAKGMNKASKIVLSRTLKKADIGWSNTKVINGNLVDAVKKLKKESSHDLTILGSGSIVTQLADAKLIDGYQIMIDPLALGSGTPIFQNMKGELELKLIKSKVFKSGVVMLDYEPR